MLAVNVSNCCGRHSSRRNLQSASAPLGERPRPSLPLRPREVLARLAHPEAVRLGGDRGELPSHFLLCFCIPCVCVCVFVDHLIASPGASPREQGTFCSGHAARDIRPRGECRIACSWRRHQRKTNATIAHASKSAHATRIRRHTTRKALFVVSMQQARKPHVLDRNVAVETRQHTVQKAQASCPSAPRCTDMHHTMAHSLDAFPTVWRPLRWHGLATDVAQVGAIVILFIPIFIIFILFSGLGILRICLNLLRVVLGTIVQNKRARKCINRESARAISARCKRMQRFAL